MGMPLFQLIAVGSGATDARTSQGMNLAFASLLTAYSQADELEADRLSAKYLRKAEYDPSAGIRFMERLQEHTRKQPARRFSYFRTHPFFADRIRVIRQASEGKITFDDYINVNPLDQ
jgi:predicted Zn-dependent protease